MFNIGDYVVYKRNVCKIKEIKKNFIKNTDYYILVPIDDESLTISIPIGNEKIARKLITKKELDNIISLIPNIDVKIIDNEKNIEQEYKKLLDSGSHEDLIKIIKTSYLRNKERTDNKKKISEKDKVYFKMAEKLLYNEFSVVLNTSYEDAKKYVIDEVNKNIGSNDE